MLKIFRGQDGKDICLFHMYVIAHTVYVIVYMCEHPHT